MGRGKSAASLTAVKLYAYNFRQREFEHSWQLAVGFYFAFLPGYVDIVPAYWRQWCQAEAT